jgi:hypothetical protein
MDEAEDKMAEEKKKIRIIKQICRWIWLGILTALILVVLMIDAPWKVLALLLILLAVHTILPKGTVKWFWLSVAAIIIILIIWVFLPDEDGNWRPYTFDEELAALQDKYAIPDSENAATIYNQLSQMSGDIVFPFDFFGEEVESLTRIEPWKSTEYPEVAKWIKDQQELISKLLDISKVEKCRLPIKPDFPQLSKYHDVLLAMRQWTFLLVRAANNDIAEGRADAALEKCLCLNQMVDHIRQQPIMLDTLIGFTIEEIAAKKIKKFIVTDKLTESHLTTIEKNLKTVKHDWCSDIPKFLEYDKLVIKDLLSFFYEINPQGKTRLSRNSISIIKAQYREKYQRHLTNRQRKLAKAAVIAVWFFMPSTPQKASKIIDNSFEKYYAMAEPDFDWQKAPPPFFSWPNFCSELRFNYPYFIGLIVDMHEKSLYQVHDLYLRRIASNRGRQIIIELKRHKNKTGRWPENLNEIRPFASAEIFIDPFNNDSFVYKLTEDNFLLYSRGKNNIDENGQYTTEWSAEYNCYKVKEDDWLIWPPRGSRLSLKEDSNNQ